MKRRLKNKIPLWMLAALASICSGLLAKEIASAPILARIIGPISDGTPPPPEPPKPTFVVPQNKVLKSKIHRVGDANLTIQHISPIALPPPPLAAPPVDITDPAIQEIIAKHRSERPNGFFFIGATVIRSADSLIRSEVYLWPAGQGEPIVFWSSENFALLSGCSTFVGTDNEERNLMMAWSFADVTRQQRSKFSVPEFPAGKATFKIISGTPDAETLISIQSLHSLFDQEKPRLRAAFEDRERLRLQQEAERLANPPKPKAIVLSTWRTSKPLTEGSAR